MEYQYPLRNDWTTEEIITVISFYEAVEKAYESNINKAKMMGAYREFKKVVPSKSEEKTLFKEFEDASGYVGYEVVRALKENTEEIQMNKKAGRA